MTAKRVAVVAFLTMVCLASAAFAQQPKTVTKGAAVIKEFKHDTGPVLREIAPLLPEYGTPPLHEIENPAIPHNWSHKAEKDPVLQSQNSPQGPQTPGLSVEFEGIGYGDDFFCNCMPPDNDGAPGTTQYVQYVNTTYQVFDKSGNTLLGPLSGNDFWSGFGGSCQSDNSGDTVVRFDAAAQVWVVSQFALNNSGDDYECIAVSQTDDATGAYNRYAYAFSHFPDYPKFGVWPDAYYFTFNNFTLSGSSFVGANACAVNRANMLAGTAATMQCFQQSSSISSLLPSDLDGAIPPATGTPNFFMTLDPDGSANLDMYAFSVNWVNPSESTFTGPTLIPVPAFTPLCEGAGSHEDCVPQPTAGSDPLEALSDRLMYRLVYRNFGDHTTLLVSHSIVAGSSGGPRWYEIHDPETSPFVYQSGTYAPDGQWRWMPSMAMDQNQDIAVGYSWSGSGAGDYPSINYAGQTPSDPQGTLESEVVLQAGAGSQKSGGFDRWGDYTSMTVDPTDDCTFWYTEEYLQATGQNGGFNWSTAIGSFSFPECGAGGTPNFHITANPNSETVALGGSGTSTVTVYPVNGFSGSVELSASGLPSGVTAQFVPNPTTSTSTLTLTVSATAAAGTSPVTITGVSGTTNTTTLNLTVSNLAPAVTLSPTSLTFTTVVVGETSTAKPVTVTNTGSAALDISSITASGAFAQAASTKPCGSTLAVGKNCKIEVTFTPTQVGSNTGTLSIYDNASNSPQTVPLSGTGGAPAALTPASMTFPLTADGTSSAAKVFTLTNHQNVALTGVSISTIGDFSVSSTTCGTGVNALGTCTIDVVFTPTEVGTETGTLSVYDSASNSPQTAALSGTGEVPATLTPATAAYAATKVGSISAAKVFTLKNHQNVALTGVSISTTGDFSVSTTTCGTSANALGTCTIDVVFTPTQTGTLTGTLQVSDSANNSPQTSSLTGTGK
ncbi:MAG: choice-of-anchor D domain-containing protein [Terriglobales bacterium]